MRTKQELCKLNHCSYALRYHLVLVTKYRRKCITATMLERLEEIARDRCVGWGGEFLEMIGEADHVHLLVSLPPTAELSRFANNIKTTTSRLIRRDFAGLSCPLVLQGQVCRRQGLVAGGTDFGIRTMAGANLDRHVEATLACFCQVAQAQRAGGDLLEMGGNRRGTGGHGTSFGI